MTQEREIERLVARIPVKLKRKIATIAALRGQTLKDLVIEVSEEWLTRQPERDII